jgi:hypothetical protein
MKNKAIFWGVLLALVVTGLAAGAVADDKPDFSGKWKMDVAKSDFGPMPAPESQTSVIDHKDPKLKVTATVKGGPQGDRTSESNYTTDGKEVTNKQGEVEIKTVGSWDGKNLVLKSKLEFQGTPVEITETWTLAEGGKQMTIARALKTGMGDFSQTSVFTKDE